MLILPKFNSLLSHKLIKSFIEGINIFRAQKFEKNAQKCIKHVQINFQNNIQSLKRLESSTHTKDFSLSKCNLKVLQRKLAFDSLKTQYELTNVTYFEFSSTYYH